jgi:rubredoxin
MKIFALLCGLVALILAIAQATPCPFGYGNHGPSMLGSAKTYFENAARFETPASSRKLLQAGFPPKVPGNVELGETGGALLKNAFPAPGDYSQPISPTIGAPSVIDTVAAMGAYRDQELCLFNFQELPPPVVSGTLDTVDLGQGDYYQYPVADMERFVMLCDLAGSRMQSHVLMKDMAVLGGCAFGSEAAKAACHLGVNSTEEGSFCVDAKLNQPVHWPMAVTIFKFTSENAAAGNEFVSSWLSQPMQHRPNTFWAMTSGQGQAEEGNQCCGGVKSAVSGGNGTGLPGINWGNNGGIFSKVVPCADINEKFMYPKGPHGTGFYGVDALSAEDSSKTFMTQVWEEWNKHCAIPVVPSATPSDCTPPEPAPGSQAAISGVPYLDQMSSPAPPSSDTYQCSRCRHLYNADSDGNGVAFEDLPDTWVCPVCGAPKSAYKAVTSSTGLIQYAHEHNTDHWEENSKQ